MQLAAKSRVDGKSVAQVLVNLGREDDLDCDALSRLVASINRYLGVPNAPAPDVSAMVGEQLAVTESRPMGSVYLLDELWRQLGIDTALGQVLGPRRFTTDVERVLFALVANRAVDPLSKLAAAQWACEDVAVPGLAGMDEDQAYRRRRGRTERPGRVSPVRPLQGPPRRPAPGRHRPGGDQGGDPGTVLVLAGEHHRGDGPAAG